MTSISDHMGIDPPDLAAIAEGAFADGQPAEEGWVVDGDREAAWALRKMREAQAEVDRVNANAAHEHDAITAWADAAKTGPDHTLAFFRGRLIGYRLHLEDENPDLARTYKLPGGRLIRRKAPDRVEVADEDALVGWALENDRDAVTFKPKVTPFKGADYGYSDDGRVVYLSDGEVVPGVRWVEGDDRYSVSVDDPAAEDVF